MENKYTKPLIEIKKIARYETDIYFFFINSVTVAGEKFMCLDYCPIYKKSTPKFTIGELKKDTRTYPENISISEIEKDIKEISGCETFKILLYDKDEQKYINDEE